MITIYYALMFILILFLGFNDEESGDNLKLKQEVDNLKAIIGPPPKSLDNLYPPYSKGPIYQIMMFEMAKPFTAISIDLYEKKMNQAETNYEKFKTKYIELSKVIPEWKEAYPLKPLEELGIALSSGEQEKAFMSIRNVGEICYDCHSVNMPKTQQKYHWGDFSEITVTDPITNKDMDYQQHMLSLEMSFQGIGLNLGLGQVGNAVQNFNSFYKRFQSMKETCSACHETERKYYVDSNIEEMLEKLRVTLKSKVQDLNLVGELSRQIGTESCFKCHLIHIPAQYSKSLWKENQMH